MLADNALFGGLPYIIHNIHYFRCLYQILPDSIFLSRLFCSITCDFISRLKVSSEQPCPRQFSRNFFYLFLVLHEVSFCFFSIVF